MITVGKLLRERRLEKKVTLAEAEKATKIRSKFLESLEKDEFDRISSATILRGFIKNYAVYLDLPLDEIMAFYRRQSTDQTLVLPEKPQVPERGFRLTPRLLTVLSVSTILAVFVSVLVIQYQNYAMSPPLEVLSPKENSVVSSEEIEISGKTDPDAALTINGESVQTANGQFQVKVPLSPGLNIITLRAINKFQKETVLTRHLRLEK